MNRMTRQSGELLQFAALCYFMAALFLWLAGCASMPTGEKVWIAATLADTATTVYGLTAYDNLHEGGILHGAWGKDDDAAIASALVVDAAIVYLVHWLYKRYPGWPGWPAVWYTSAAVRAGVAAHNLHVILEQE